MPVEAQFDGSAPSTNTLRNGAATAFVLVAMFYLAAVPLILRNGGMSSRAAADQDNFHLPVIQQFICQWPHVDLTDYASATTPGYHLAVAWIGRVVGFKPVVLRLSASLFTAALLGILGWNVGKRLSFPLGLLVCLPVACSIYVFSSGAFLLPDNAGWLGVLGVMLVALRPKLDGWTYVLGGLFLLASVFVRQIDLWLLVPLLTAVFVRAKTQTPNEPPPSAGAPASAVALPPVKALAFSFAILPSILLLLWFRHLWHGTLVPPNQRSLTSGFAPAAPAIIMSITAIVAVFYGGLLLPDLKSVSAIVSGAIAGAVLGVLPVTTYDVADRRFSGIWNAVLHFPYWMNRSPLIIALSALGGAAVVAWLTVLPRRERWIWGSAALAFTLAQLASANPWQRYYEPFILMAAALSAPLLVQNGTRRRIPSWEIVGPLALSILCATATVLGFIAR